MDESRALQPAPESTPTAPHLFGGAGVEYQRKYGARDETFAKISEKARRHALHDERAIFRELLTVEQVLATPRIYGVLTRAQCCPPTCGAAAAVLVSEEFAKRHGQYVTDVDQVIGDDAQAIQRSMPVIPLYDSG